MKKVFQNVVLLERETLDFCLVKKNDDSCIYLLFYIHTFVFVMRLLFVVFYLHVLIFFGGKICRHFLLSFFFK